MGFIATNGFINKMDQPICGVKGNKKKWQHIDLVAKWLHDVVFVWKGWVSVQLNRLHSRSKNHSSGKGGRMRAVQEGGVA